MKWYWWLLGAGAFYFLLKPGEAEAGVPDGGGGGELLIGTPKLTITGPSSVPPDFLQKLVAFYTLAAEKCQPDPNVPDRFCCPASATITAAMAANGALQILCVTSRGKYVIDQFANLAEAYNQVGYISR